MRTRSLGILGGGQLAQMLAEAALSLDAHPRAYVESAGSPVERVIRDEITLGRIEEVERLREFLASCSVVVFENEFIDCSKLEEASRGLSTRFVPGLGAIRTLQDKWNQKRLLLAQGVPTAECEKWNASEDSVPWARRKLEQWQDGAVFKWSRLGYDGKGVLIAGSDFTEWQRLERFFQEATDRGGTVFAERRIRFRRELAISCAISTSGAAVFYPLVVSRQRDGICELVTGPASALGATAEQETAAREYCEKVARAAALQGCFALELFETESGGLLVNEIAPRVHNSAHYSQDACKASQFENHCRVALGMELAPASCAPAFAMINLIGPEGIRLPDPAGVFPSDTQGVQLHWYSKSEIRPGRKLGHVNASSNSENIASLAARLESYERRWEKGLRDAEARERKK